MKFFEKRLKQNDLNELSRVYKRFEDEFYKFARREKLKIENVESSVEIMENMIQMGRLSKNKMLKATALCMIIQVWRLVKMIDRLDSKPYNSTQEQIDEFINITKESINTSLEILKINKLDTKYQMMMDSIEFFFFRSDYTLEQIVRCNKIQDYRVYSAFGVLKEMEKIVSFMYVITYKKDCYKELRKNTKGILISEANDNTTKEIFDAFTGSIIAQIDYLREEIERKEIKIVKQDYKVLFLRIDICFDALYDILDVKKTNPLDRNKYQECRIFFNI